MKTVVVILVLLVIAFYAFKSLYKSMKGEGGCSCSAAKESGCPMKGKCPK